MKHILSVLFCLMLIANLSACSDDDNSVAPVTPTQPEQPAGNQNNIETMKVEISIGSVKFTATLEDNATARDFSQLLPMTISMTELNGNEKYFNLPKALLTNSYNVGTIRNGDLMLYGSTTLVLFYKTFSTSYSYTKVGSVDNPSELTEALGSGNATVTIDILK